MMVMRFDGLPDEIRARVLRQKAEDLLDAWLDAYGEDYQTDDELMMMAVKMLRADKGGN